MLAGLLGGHQDAEGGYFRLLAARGRGDSQGTLTEASRCLFPLIREPVRPSRARQRCQVGGNPGADGEQPDLLRRQGAVGQGRQPVEDLAGGGGQAAGVQRLLRDAGTSSVSGKSGADPASVAVGLSRMGSH